MRVINKIISQLFVLVLISNGAQAIDLSVTNESINPASVPSFSTYTLAFDINNQSAPPALTPEDAQFVTISISGYDPSNNGGVISNTPSWACVDNFNTIDCSRSFTISEFPPGSTEPFSIDIGTNSIVINPDTFIVNVSEEAGPMEDNFADNMVTIFSAPAGAVPDLEFDIGVTQAIYSGIENQAASVALDFSVLNTGGDALSGVQMFISHNESLFNIDTLNSTIPPGWNCGVETGGTNCNTNNTVAMSSITNFTLAYDVSSAAANSYPFDANLTDFGFNETNVSNNFISTQIDLAAASPDLFMNIVTPNTFPVGVTQGSTVATPFTYRLENLGNTVFAQNTVQVDIVNNLAFNIANVQTTAPGWACNPITVGFRCVNSGIGNILLPMDQIDFTGEITSYPTAIMEFTDAVTATVTDTSGIEAAAGNAGNNSFDISVEIVSPPLDTDIVLTKFAKEGAGISNVISADWPIGTNFYYHIHVDNISTVAADMVDVGDQLPAGVQFVNDLSLGSWVCFADPFIDEFTPQSVTCSYPSIPANSPNFGEFIVLEVAPLNIGLKSNTATASTIVNDIDPTNNNNAASPANVNVVAAAIDPDVEVTKTFLSGVFFDKIGPTAGENTEVVYQILVNNLDMAADNASNVVISDILPAGVTFVSFNELGNFTGNCAFIAGTGPSGEVSCTAASIPFTAADDGVEITVNVTGAPGTFVDNTVTMTVDNDATPGNNTDSTGPFEILGSLSQIDLAMNKEAQTLVGVSASNFDVNENFNYVLTISNSGPDDAAATEVLVTDLMPSGIEIVNISSAVNWNCSKSDLPTGIIDCFNTTSIDAGTSEEIIIEVLSQTAANYDNIANVDLDFSSSAIDADLNNNSDNAIVDIIAVGGSELFFAKDVVGGVDVGGVFDVTENVNFEYKLIIDNVSAGTSFNDLVVTDSVDVGFLSVQSVSSDLAGFNCSASGNDVTCTQDGSTPLLPGAQAVITIEVFPNAIGSNIDNVANISSVASAEDIDSNIVTINVIPVAGGLVDLDLLKDAQTVGGSTSVDQFLIGESFEYNIVVHNTGPDDAPIGNVRVVDALPPDIDLDAVPSSPDWDCSATVGTIVDCTNITAIPASTGFLSLIIPVSSQAEGVYVNSADVSLAVGSLLTDTDISNNNGTKSVTINPVQGNITLMKSVNGGSAQTRSVKKRGTNTNFAIGDSVSYTLLAQNTSAINSVTDLVVSDTLDTNFLAYDQFNILQSSANFTCNFDGTSQFSCTNAGGGPLNPGDSFEVEIIAIAAAPGINISNTAQASSVITGDNINSNTVFIDIDSGATPTTLTVQKQAFVNGVAVNSVTKGNAFNYRIDIQNTGPNDAQNLELIDNVPAGISVNSVSGTDWACSNVGQEYTCNLLNPLLSNSSTFVEFNVFDNTAANINQVQNVVDVTSDNALMVSAVNNLDLTQVSLDFNVSQNPDPVVENTVFELIVDIANTGSEALEGVQIVNTLPDGFSYVAQKFGNNCTINGQQMTCNVSNPIANGATETLILQINAITEANANASYINMTTLTGSNFPSQIAENTVLNVVQDGQLSYTVSIDDNIDPVPVGSSFMYDVSFTNNGDLPISTMVFEVVLPSELALTSSNPNNATCTTTNSGLACQSSGFLNLFPGETISLLTLDVNSPSFVGDVTASVSAIAENTLSASDTEVTTIASVQASIADLSVQKSADQKSITTGNQLSWNIDVTNLGPDSAQNVKITDQLPEGFEVISATLNGQDVCQDKGKNLMCNLGILNNQESATVTVLGTVLLESGVLENTVSVSSDTIDEEMKNNTDSASVMVNPVAMTNADIFLNISAEEAVIDKGVAQFNINVGNNGPDSAVSPSISMMASGNIENILLGASNDWNCQVNKSINITCSFVGTAMSESFETTFDVKLIPVEPMGSETTIVALTATISSETDDPDLSNNTGSAEVSTTGGPPTEQQILGALQEALAGIANQQTLKAIENVSSYCANSYENALNGLCDNLYNAALGDQGELVNEVMEQITPNEVIGQSTSVSEIASAQFRNVGSRLAELRGGGGSGFSTAGLNATYGNGSIPLGMLAYLNDASDESEGLSKPDPSFISPWGFFVNGTISMGERDATGRELGFDFDSYGLTAGVDYRLDARKVLGLALGYANFDSKIDDSAEIKSSGVTLTGYGSFYVNDNFYVDSRISLAKPDFDQSRNINFEIDDISVARTAVGKTDANQYSFAMSAGYHFNKNAWNITPNASVNYIKTNIDSFTETGAQEFNFFYSEQDIESLVWSAGMKVSKAISLSNGVITPQFDLDYNYESLNDGVNIEARFIMAPDDEIFIIETDTPDRTYGSAGLGLVYISSNGKQAYINYRSLFGLDGFDRGTFNIGARFEF